MNTKRKNFFEKNGLSIIFIVFAVSCLAAQIFTGLQEHNEFLNEHGRASIGIGKYLQSGHFLQATFENWESEFLQMALFVILTIFFRQQGSSESKTLTEEDVDPLHLRKRKSSPWPVRKGGIWLSLYKHSLSIALILLFIVSFFLHWYGSWLDFNQKQAFENKPLSDFFPYLEKSKFWFESFQNWQSEFLSIFMIIFLSIYLRQYGSSQSKPVNMSHKEIES
jgi:hypothetical protein